MITKPVGIAAKVSHAIVIFTPEAGITADIKVTTRSPGIGVGAI